MKGGFNIPDESLLFNKRRRDQIDREIAKKRLSSHYGHASEEDIDEFVEAKQREENEAYRQMLMARMVDDSDRLGYDRDQNRSLYIY